jgi:5-methylcytosine-specific restriction endonuclease McrA
MADWTEGRLKAFITSALRGAFRRFPNKYETLKNAFVGKKINKKTNRLSAHYLCAGCKEEFPTSEVQVDHILPIVDPEIGFISWDEFIKNLFCPSNNLQVLCVSCHKQKTLLENKARKNKCTPVQNVNKKNNKRKCPKTLPEETV